MANKDQLLADIANGIVADTPEHEKIENGTLFRNALKFDIASGGSHQVLIRCGAKEAHITLGADVDGDTQITMSEDPTITDVGTQEPAGNFNFNSDNVNTTLLYDGPTYSDIGTYKANTWVFGGHTTNPANSTHASPSLNGGYVVTQPNTDYIINFINKASRDLQIFFQMDFYEVTP